MNGLNQRMPRWRVMHILLMTALISIIALTDVSDGMAEVRVAGPTEAVRIEAQDATVAEVLEALGSSFQLRYRSFTPLTKSVSGTYEGPLQRVLARLLEGYDNVMKSSHEGIQVTIYDRNEGRAGIPAAGRAGSGRPMTVPSSAPNQTAPRTKSNPAARVDPARPRLRHD